LEEAGLTKAERALLDYVKLITEAAHRSTPEDVQKLRDVGWKEEQIAEAVYVVALFAFFNRVAVDREAGTIVWPNGLDLDPDMLYEAAHDTVVGQHREG